MPRKQERWAFSPASKSKSRVVESIKVRVQAKADHFIESELKPQHVKPPPQDESFNYIVDIYSKWHGNYFYFCAKYRCPAPNCISEFFEVKFARLENVEGDRFNLSYMRHTDRWWELYTDLELGECLEIIRNEPHFLP